MTGSITNNGSISGPGSGIAVFGNIGGSVVNNSSISTAYSAILISQRSIAPTFGNVAGSVINNGSITVTPANGVMSFGIGIGVFTAGAAGGAHVAGSVVNNGSITMSGETAIAVKGTSAVGGSVINNGTIDVSGFDPNAGPLNFSEGISVINNAVVTGAVENTAIGHITAADYGVLLINSFAAVGGAPIVGSVLNSGSITSTGTGFGGIGLAGAVVTNDVANAAGATIQATQGAGVLISNATPSAANLGASSVGGRVVNQGTIAAKTGIMVDGASTVAGGIFNTGSLGGSRAAIDVAGEGAATSINQMGGAITGDILLSALGDTVNVTGRTISGNIVGQASTGSVNFALGGGSFTYAGDISGVSAVNVNSGLISLIGVNAHTGSTNVNGGVLDVEGSIAASSMTTVNNGGALMGTGVVGNTTIAGGGVLAPGDGAPGTALSVQGALAFQSGSFYQVVLNASTGEYDQCHGRGDAGGGGAGECDRVVPLQHALYDPDRFGLRRHDVQRTGHVGRRLHGLAELYRRRCAADVAVVAGRADRGERQSARRRDGARQRLQRNGRDEHRPVRADLFRQCPADLTQASGELATRSQQTTFDAMGLFVGLLTDPFMDRNDGALGPGGTVSLPAGASGYAADSLQARRGDAYQAIYAKPAPLVVFTPHWNVWGAGFGGMQTTIGNTTVGSNNASSSIAGVAVGADYHIAPDTIAGFAIGGGGTNFSVDNGLGSGHSDLLQAGVYVRHTEGPAYIAAALAYGWQDITTDPHRDHRGRRPFAGEIRRQRFFRPRRGRLPLRDRVDAADALRRSTVRDLRPAGLLRAGDLGREHLRADLCRQGRHGAAHRTRLPRRPILCDAGRDIHPAWPPRLGA